MSEIKKNNVPEEILDEELEGIAGGITYPSDWNSLTIEQKRARLVMSQRKRELNMVCEFDA